MIILKKDSNYIISEVHTLDSEKQLEVLECFLSDYDVFLFAYVE